jgi:hypothetical protein
MQKLKIHGVQQETATRAYLAMERFFDMRIKRLSEQ